MKRKMVIKLKFGVYIKRVRNRFIKILKNINIEKEN